MIVIVDGYDYDEDIHETHFNIIVGFEPDLSLWRLNVMNFCLFFLCSLCSIDWIAVYDGWWRAPFGDEAFRKHSFVVIIDEVMP